MDELLTTRDGTAERDAGSSEFPAKLLLAICQLESYPKKGFAKNPPHLSFPFGPGLQVYFGDDPGMIGVGLPASGPTYSGVNGGCGPLEKKAVCLVTCVAG